MRIIDCAWKIYGSNVDVLNDQLIDFYIMVIKKDWIKYIYPIISKYIYVDENNIYFKKNSDDENSNQIEKINFFFKKIINKQFIYKFLYSYIEMNKSNWDDIKSHSKLMLEYLIDYIISKIKLTITQDENSKK